MLRFEEALKTILSQTPVVADEQVPLMEAYGRILSQDLVSPIDVPPWNNSAMDGFAVRSADTASGSTTLKVVGMIGAGEFPTMTIREGCCAGIMTGAPVPPGADAVVMVENTNGSYEGTVDIYKVAQPGQNIRPQGGDVTVGSTALKAGTRLTPASVGLAASLGHAIVPVRKRPIVAILSTGDEIVAPGNRLEKGQIYASNNTMLAGMVLETGAQPIDLGIVPDTLQGSLEALSHAVEQADVVMTTGGVSAGEFDYIKKAFDELGVGMGFWKVKMKPGKPLAFGRHRIGDRSVAMFGLPGNPVSCAVNYLQFVRPYLLKRLGYDRPFLPVIKAIAGEDLADRSDRLKFLRVTLEQTESGIIARSTGTQSSGVLTSMSLAHGLAILGPENNLVEAGEEIDVQLLNQSFLDKVDSLTGV